MNARIAGHSNFATVDVQAKNILWEEKQIKHIYLKNVNLIN